MQKLFFSLLLILVSAGSVFSQDNSPAKEVPGKSKKFIYQIAVGSAYSTYFPLIETAIGSMNTDSVSRFPFNLDFLFGRKMTDKTAWTVSLTTGMDLFSESSDFFQIYTIMAAGGLRFTPFDFGLYFGVHAGVSILFPNTNLSYTGKVEAGSGIAVDFGYLFNSLKFSRAGIIPGLGIKIIHSELFRGTAEQLKIYINLAIN